MSREFQLAGDFVMEVCCECSMSFAMPKDFNDRRRADHLFFYCPSGHRQHYTGKSEAEIAREAERKAREEAERFKQCAEHKKETISALTRSISHYRGEITKLKKKIGK